MATSGGTEMEQGGQPQEIGLVLDLARGALDQEFQVAERLDAKSRGQMTLAGAWFAVVQAVAGTALGIRGFDEGWALAILVLAGGSGLALAIAVGMSYQVWKLRPERDFEPEAVVRFADLAYEPGTLSATLPDYYKRLLEERRRQNAIRVRAFRRSMWAWGFTFALPLLELLVALAGRFFEVA